MPRLLPLVVSLAATGLVAGEPLTLTAWDVRKEAVELLDEIGRGQGSGDLLLRAQAMLAAHGAELVPISPTEAAPIATAVSARLQAAGLDDEFARLAAPAAQRRLDELLAAPADPARLAALARLAPGTPAAQKAWRLAADLAWDRGQLRLYADAAAWADEGADRLRRARLAAAAALATLPGAETPADLDRLDLMWQLQGDDLPRRHAEGDDDEEMPRRRRASGGAAGAPGLAACGGAAVALADGRTLAVVDHLTGARLGAFVALGGQTLPPQVCAPVAVPDGAVAVGLTQGRIVLVRVDGAGAERWRGQGGDGAVETVSRPLVVDGLVVVAYRVSGNDRVEQRALALRLGDGQPAWDVAVCQLAVPRWGGNRLRPPTLTSHARGVMLGSNGGSVALLGCDGTVLRVWSYPVRNERGMDDGSSGRRGLSASDGLTAVISPADHPGLVLVLGPDDRAPRAFRGDGADGDVLAVQGGEAVLAGRQITLLDCASLRPRWNAPLRLAEPQATLSAGHVLVAGNDQLALLDRAKGVLLSGRALGEPATMALADGIMVLADAKGLRGFGDAASFLARLRAAADAAGSDPRPHEALAAVLAGRGDADAALAVWSRALELGAGPGIAERMARVLRARIAAGGDAATAAMARLETLVPHLPGLADELAWWRANQAETTGDRATALRLYTALMAGGDHLLARADGLSVNLRLLAAAGAERCGAAGAWRPFTAPPSPPPPVLGGAWPPGRSAHGRLVLAGDAVCGFADGLLRAWNLADGGERWRRTPLRPLLGVTFEGREAEDGIPVNVIPGSAAAAAGLRQGDVLLTLGGAALKNFEADLRPAVLALGGGAPFTFRVRGADGAERTVEGRIGGEPLEPLAASPTLILARATVPLAQNRTDLRFFAIDPATGRDLWSQVLSQDEERGTRLLPRLVGEATVAADGPDLVGIARDGTVRWRLADRADLLARAAILGRCLWLAGDKGEGVLLDATTGSELARLPAGDGPDPPALGEGLLAVRERDGRIAVWDLGQGRLRCRSAEPARPLAVRGDNLLAIDARGRPTVLDVQTGAGRRNLSEATVELHALGEAQALLALAAPDRRSLAAVALDGLGLRWSLDLPPGLEIEALRPSGDGLVAVLREGVRTWALLIDAGGVPRATAAWQTEAGGDVLPLGPTALVSATTGLQPLRAAPGGVPSTLRCTALDAAIPMREALAAALPSLAFSAPEGPALALARHGPHLLVAVRNPTPGTLPLRLADLGGPIALDVSRANLTPRGTRVTVPGSWNLIGQWQAGEIACSAWLPLPSRAPGAPVAVLLGEPDGQPWWLTAHWLRVADPP